MDTFGNIINFLFKFSVLILFAVVVFQFVAYRTQPTNMDILLILLASIPDKD